MEFINTLIRNPAYHDVLAILKGARNGLVYGAKIRFPHALVMSFLFHGDRPWKDRAKFVFNATRQHSLNLCKFVTIYKTALLAQRKVGGGKERSSDTFLAGLIGGWIVFGERTAINEQIVLYCVSRVVSSFLPRSSASSIQSKPKVIVTQNSPADAAYPPSALLGSKEQMPDPPGFPYPASVPIDSRAFEVFAALTWGAVMWLFRWRRHTLQGGLVNSMQYLYLDSEVWSNWKNLLWHNIA
ncbi:hypothetical protein O181_010874 [Austropuccinia psidii MF-1]|uniref:Peroxisomal membrane protein 4 n=1 Tax=Austropuccinia psidii MF-1 TaxID=1389203 RepID=A0A9Q3GLB1_9BASI|nr:hypothetical protein [Austropuccinia psidii MF-1]